MENSVTLAVVVALLTIITTTTGGGGGGVVAVGAASPRCTGRGSSRGYRANKAHVLDELVNVTPTRAGFNYATTFPPKGSAAGAAQVVGGFAACTFDVGVSECVSCLKKARRSLQRCGSRKNGKVTLSRCNMGYLPI